MKCIPRFLLGFQLITLISSLFRKRDRISNWIINTYNHITFHKFKCLNYVIKPCLVVAPSTSI